MQLKYNIKQHNTRKSGGTVGSRKNIVESLKLQDFEIQYWMTEDKKVKPGQVNVLNPGRAQETED